MTNATTIDSIRALRGASESELLSIAPHAERRDGPFGMRSYRIHLHSTWMAIVSITDGAVGAVVMKDGYTPPAPIEGDRNDPRNADAY